ncbi:hypothetical protein ABH968_001849 [Lysinibacillus sp. RC79]
MNIILAHHQKLWMTFVKTYAIYKLIGVETGRLLGD